MLIQKNDPDAPQRPSFFRTTPPILLGLAVVIIAVSLVQFNASAPLEDYLLRAGAVITGPGAEQFDRPFGTLAPLALHTFLHVAIWHLVINMAAMISLGAAVATVLGKTTRGAVAFLAFFFVCAIGGGLAQLLAAQFSNEMVVAIGASSAISGLLPAVGWLQGGWKRAVRISIPWFLINVGLAIFGHLSPIAIGWAAHLGGLALGFSFPLFLYWARPQLSRR